MSSRYKERAADARVVAALLLERRIDLASCMVSRLARGRSYNYRKVSAGGLRASAIRLVEALADAIADDPVTFSRYVATRARLAARSGGDQERLQQLLGALQEEAWLLAAAHLEAEQTEVALCALSACIGEARDMLARTIAEQACADEAAAGTAERGPPEEGPSAPSPNRPADAPAGER